MAASPELDDPIFDLIGQSLLEVIEEKNRTLNKVCDCMPTMSDAESNIAIL